MKPFILSTAIFLLGAAALAQEIDREAVAVAEVTRYVMDWTRNVPQSYRRRALQHVPSVAVHSLRYQVDPLLTAVMVSLESSWNMKACGKLGEIGLMQVHADRAKVGYDNLVEDPDQQVEAGVKWLRTCIDMCGGDVKDGVALYGTGQTCKARWSALDYRWGLYERAVKKFRGAT